ncbi:terpene synthase family protein [Kitasatospora purpeofusca]|uniref:terpene synthase family protein n=1 Tax=Kitasatospora purpeofusca TaxID=67352 RepID=UPI0035DC5F33
MDPVDDQLARCGSSDGSYHLDRCAVTPGLFFIELTGGFELTAADFADPRVRGLREMVVALVGWDNDITSYNKELYRATHYGYPSLQNLITVLAHHHACPTERAVAEPSATR